MRKVSLAGAAAVDRELAAGRDDGRMGRAPGDITVPIVAVCKPSLGQ